MTEALQQVLATAYRFQHGYTVTLADLRDLASRSGIANFTLASEKVITDFLDRKGLFAPREESFDEKMRRLYPTRRSEGGINIGAPREIVLTAKTLDCPALRPLIRRGAGAYTRRVDEAGRPLEDWQPGNPFEKSKAGDPLSWSERRARTRLIGELVDAVLELDARTPADGRAKADCGLQLKQGPTIEVWFGIGAGGSVSIDLHSAGCLRQLRQLVSDLHALAEAEERLAANTARRDHHE